MMKRMSNKGSQAKLMAQTEKPLTPLKSELDDVCEKASLDLNLDELAHYSFVQLLNGRKICEQIINQILKKGDVIRKLSKIRVFDSFTNTMNLVLANPDLISSISSSQAENQLINQDFEPVNNYYVNDNTAYNSKSKKQIKASEFIDKNKTKLIKKARKSQKSGLQASIISKKQTQKRISTKSITKKNINSQKKTHFKNQKSNQSSQGSKQKPKFTILTYKPKNYVEDDVYIEYLRFLKSDGLKTQMAIMYFLQRQNKLKKKHKKQFQDCVNQKINDQENGQTQYKKIRRNTKSSSNLNPNQNRKSETIFPEIDKQTSIDINQNTQKVVNLVPVKALRRSSKKQSNLQVFFSDKLQSTTPRGVLKPKEQIQNVKSHKRKDTNTNTEQSIWSKKQIIPQNVVKQKGPGDYSAQKSQFSIKNGNKIIFYPQIKHKPQKAKDPFFPKLKIN